MEKETDIEKRYIYILTEEWKEMWKEREGNTKVK